MRHCMPDLCDECNESMRETKKRRERERKKREVGRESKSMDR